MIGQIGPLGPWIFDPLEAKKHIYPQPHKHFEGVILRGVWGGGGGKKGTGEGGYPALRVPPAKPKSEAVPKQVVVPMKRGPKPAPPDLWAERNRQLDEEQKKKQEADQWTTYHGNGSTCSNQMWSPCPAKGTKGDADLTPRGKATLSGHPDKDGPPADSKWRPMNVDQRVFCPVPKEVVVVRPTPLAYFQE